MTTLSAEDRKRIADGIDEDSYCQNIAKAGTEHAEQRAFFAWLMLMENRGVVPLARMAYAVPNGGKRDAVTAARLKAEGVKSGVPDVCWPVPVGRYPGLYLELKIPGGAVSSSQEEWHNDLRAVGHAVAVCYGWRSARLCFLAYSRGEEPATIYR